MARPTKKASAPGDDTPDATSAPRPVAQAFQDASTRYFESLEDLQLSTQRKYTQAYQNYLLQLQQGTAGTQLSDAKEKYAERLQAAYNEQNLSDIYDANRNYAETCQQALESAGKDATDAARQLVEALQDIAATSQKVVQSEYTDYVAALKKNWGQVDATTADAATLASIAQSVLSTAYYAGR